MVSGIYVGPPRRGLNHYNGPCQTKYAMRALRLSRDDKRMMIQFDDILLPQHLVCHPDDLDLEPEVDWETAQMDHIADSETYSGRTIPPDSMP